MLSVWLWIKAKWKIIVGVIMALFAFFVMMFRNKVQKKALEAANKAHRAENKANNKAREDLVDGLEKLDNEKEEKEKEIVKETKEKEEKLEEEKEKFIEDVQESGTLIDELAKHLNAEIVETKDD
jgi:alcohol dehydrogenase class IV